jgi:uncharacterized protein
MGVNMFNKIKITWQQYGEMVRNLYEQICNNHHTKFNFVIGPVRGGLPLAVFMSHNLDIPMMVNNYLFTKNQNLLIVDDIADTGQTLEFYYSQLVKENNVTTGVLHLKPRSIFKPNYHVEETLNDNWIVYPYEKFEEEPNRELP